MHGSLRFVLPTQKMTRYSLEPQFEGESLVLIGGRQRPGHPGLEER